VLVLNSGCEGSRDLVDLCHMHLPQGFY
jgi:hypothetical protein